MNLSQEELEEVSDVSVSTIGRIEKNERKPSLEVIEKLERALGIELREVIEDYWKDAGGRSEKYSLQRDAMRDFRREIENRNLNDEQLRRLFDKILSEADSENEKDSSGGKKKK